MRLISATNKDLAEMAAEKTFREDLLYRINVVTLTIPPLRRRAEDIRPLADRFIAKACEEHRRTITRVEPGFYERLLRYEWPGNIRQLRNVIESSVLFTAGDTLAAANLNLPVDANHAGGKRGAGDVYAPDGMTLDQIEKCILDQALTRCQGNRTLTAEKLGLSRRTIQRKIKEHNLPF